MSRQSSIEHSLIEPTEALEVIREELSPVVSYPKITPIKSKKTDEITPCCENCKCAEVRKPYLEMEEVDNLLKEKEEQLTAEFNERLTKEIDALRDRADFVLQNEQIRASYMLREAHRDRQEKISALQTQLECKNLAGLMYVICMERKKNKMEKMAIIEEYSNYIRALQDILTEAQSLILNLSRGYKTAARVDNEWRQKMKKTLFEFQLFVQDFTKGAPESEQFFFDLPKLLHTEASTVDDLLEDPCTCADDDTLAEQEEKTAEPEKLWFERLDPECRPFVMFGDMAEFKPPQRRETLRAMKAVKTAPRKWKEYVFHDMFVNAECLNADSALDEFLSRPSPVYTAREEPSANVAQRELGSARQSTQYGQSTHRATYGSVDLRGMGSILKMITTSNDPRPQTKAMLLGARDSMEIVSTTKLKHKFSDASKVVLKVATRRTSLFEDNLFEEDNPDGDQAKPVPEATKTKEAEKVDEDDDEGGSTLGSIHNDSLTVVSNHRPDRDHNIRYEKVCPVEKCRRQQVDSFMRSLPAYMSASPFTHFEQGLDEYEPCSPEQLEILRDRIDRKRKKEKLDQDQPELNPLEEWRPIVEGTAVQTSDISMSLPPCTCRDPKPSSVASNDGQTFNLLDLYPMKQVLNQINRDCFFDNTIQFDRFKVIGHESSDTIREQKARELSKKQTKLSEVTKVLKEHPSLLDIFQANAV